MLKYYLKYIFFPILLSFPGFVSAQDTVKVMAYNLLNYDYTDTNRFQYYRTIIQSSNPDIIVAEEILSQNAVNYFRDRVLNILGIGNFSAGTFINGYDTDNAIFFKASKFAFLSNTPIHTELRDINEFRVVHTSTSDTLRLYAVHLKANNTTADQQQRGREVDSLRKVTNALPLNSNFIVLGDFNIYSSNETAYQKLLQVTPGNEGHFYDMLNLSGTWNNQVYSLYHTQSTRVRQFGGGSTGGMDDRFDMILYSKAVRDTGRVTIISQSLNAYGNDGNHYNDSINKPPNNAVGQVVANALHYASDHLPIIALLKFESTIGIKQISGTVFDGYALEQNFPNPFNPATKIKFSVPPVREQNAQPLRLVVYDVLGREVSTLVNEELSPGEYEVTFNAGKLTSGIYYYSLTAGYYTVTKKMILIK